MFYLLDRTTESQLHKMTSDASATTSSAKMITCKCLRDFPPIWFASHVAGADPKLHYDILLDAAAMRQPRHRPKRRDDDASADDDDGGGGGAEEKRREVGAKTSTGNVIAVHFPYFRVVGRNFFVPNQATLAASRRHRRSARMTTRQKTTDLSTVTYRWQDRRRQRRRQQRNRRRRPMRRRAKLRRRQRQQRQPRRRAAPKLVARRRREPPPSCWKLIVLSPNEIERWQSATLTTTTMAQNEPVRLLRGRCVMAS